MNPRAGCPTYRISSADPSATWVHLRVMITFSDNISNYIGSGIFRQLPFLYYFPKNIEIPTKILYNVLCIQQFAERSHALPGYLLDGKCRRAAVFMADVTGLYFVKGGCKMKRIGMLTSGGDCQALNAAMRGVVKCLSCSGEDVEIYGFLEGYKGLIYSDFRMLTGADFSGILTKGGTILGSSRTPFKLMREPDENGLDKVEAMKQNYYKLKLDCMVILGGNGTHKTANMLREEGLNVVTLPKTIDNDLWGTDMTFGFQSAVDIATKCIDDIHTTASSHGRIFYRRGYGT